MNHHGRNAGDCALRLFGRTRAHATCGICVVGGVHVGARHPGRDKISVTIALAAALIWLGRLWVDFSLKAAALIVAAILATPHSLDYDMTTLAPAIAFLAAHGLRCGFALGRNPRSQLFGSPPSRQGESPGRCYSRSASLPWQPCLGWCCGAPPRPADCRFGVISGRIVRADLPCDRSRHDQAALRSHSLSYFAGTFSMTMHVGKMSI